MIIKSATPQRSGYVFKGWNTSSNGSGTSFKPGDTITLSGDGYSKDISRTLYAVWEAITSCQFSLNYNGNGSGATNVPSTETKSSTNSECKFVVRSAPRRNGYTFKAWNTKANGSGTSFMPGTEITVRRSGTSTTASTTLYAIWQKNGSSTTPAPTAAPTQRPTQKPTATPKPTNKPTNKPTATSKPTNTHAPTAIPVKTVETKRVDKLADGGKTFIYSRYSGIVITAKDYDYWNDDNTQKNTLIGVEAERYGKTLFVPETAAYVTVEISDTNGEKLYAFKNQDGKYLFCDGTDLQFVKRTGENKQYTLFVLEEQNDGDYYIRSKSADEKPYITCDGKYFMSDDLENNDAECLMSFYSVKGDMPEIHDEPVNTPEPKITKTVTAKAVDENNLPLQDVRIAIYDADHVALGAGYSKINGEVVFDSLELGTYEIKIVEVPTNYDLDSTVPKTIEITESYDESACESFTVAKIVVPDTPEPTEVPVEPTPVPAKAGDSCTSTNVILYIAIAVIVLAAAAAAIIFIIKKKKNNSYRYEDEYEDDDRYEDDDE